MPRIGRVREAILHIITEKRVNAMDLPDALDTTAAPAPTTYLDNASQRMYGYRFYKGQLRIA